MVISFTNKYFESWALIISNKWLMIAQIDF